MQNTLRNSLATASLAVCIAMAVSGSTAQAQISGGTQWQTTQMQGMFTNAPVGLMLSTSTVPNLLTVRSPGVVSGPPTEWTVARFGPPTASHPDYSTATLLAGLNRAPHNLPDAATLEFGGFSTGGDVCPSLASDGRLMISNSWYFLSVTVGSSQPGHVFGNSGSALSSVAEPERAILSYYAEGSTGIDASLVNSTLVEQTAAQVGFPVGSTVKLTGLDWGMGAISVDPNSLRSLRFAPVRDRVYFSVSNAWLAVNPSFFAWQDTVPVPMDARTIYSMRWVVPGGLAAPYWAAPEVAVTSEELFGAADGPTVELDAISVFMRPAPHNIMRVVYSTTRACTPPDELLAYDRGTMGGATRPGPVPLRTASGAPVSGRMGLKTSPETDIDNVTGTCGADPEAGVPGDCYGVGMSGLIPGGKRPLGLAVCRSISSTGPAYAPTDVVDMQVSGLDLASGKSGWVHYYVGFPTLASLLSLSGAPPVWYYAGSAHTLHGQSTVNLQMPGNLGNLGALSVSAVLQVDGDSAPSRSSWISVITY